MPPSVIAIVRPSRTFVRTTRPGTTPAGPTSQRPGSSSSRASRRLGRRAQVASSVGDAARPARATSSRRVPSAGTGCPGRRPRRAADRPGRGRVASASARAASWRRRRPAPAASRTLEAPKAWKPRTRIGRRGPNAPAARSRSSAASASSSVSPNLALPAAPMMGRASCVATRRRGAGAGPGQGCDVARASTDASSSSSDSIVSARMPARRAASISRVGLAGPGEQTRRRRRSRRAAPRASSPPEATSAPTPAAASAARTSGRRVGLDRERDLDARPAAPCAAAPRAGARRRGRRRRAGCRGRLASASGSWPATVVPTSTRGDVVDRRGLTGARPRARPEQTVPSSRCLTMTGTETAMPSRRPHSDAARARARARRRAPGRHDERRLGRAAQLALLDEVDEPALPGEDDAGPERPRRARRSRPRTARSRRPRTPRPRR